MHQAQGVLLPIEHHTVKTRIGILYTPVYQSPSAHLHFKVPAQLVVTLAVEKYPRPDSLEKKETKRLLIVTTHQRDNTLWTKVAETGARIRQDHPWAANFFDVTINDIRRDNTQMVKACMTHVE